MSICRVRNVKIRSKPALPVPTLPLRHGLSHAGDGYDPVPLAGTGHKAGLMSDEQSKKLAGLSSSSSTQHITINNYTFPGKPLTPSPDDDEFEDGVDGFLSRWQPVLWTPSPDDADRGLGFVSPSGEWRLEGNKRPSWIQIQPPVDLAVGFFTKALSQPAATRQFIVWSLSIDHNQDLIGGELFAAGWGQSLVGGPISPIDGDNLVFVNVQRLGVEQYAVTLNVTEAGVNTIYAGAASNLPIRFVGILKDETTYTALFSSDGVTWRHGDSGIANIVPERVTVGLVSGTLDNPIFGFDFFRVYPDATV